MLSEDALKRLSKYPILRGSYFEAKIENGVGRLFFVGVAGDVRIDIDKENISFSVQKISNFKNSQLMELEPKCCFSGKMKNIRDIDFTYRLKPDDIFGRENKLLMSLTIDLADDKKNNTHGQIVYFFPKVINHDYAAISKSSIVFV